jgi:hypothetical protein
MSKPGPVRGSRKTLPRFFMLFQAIRRIEEQFYVCPPDVLSFGALEVMLSP